MNAAPNMPNPPAFETAATNGGKDTQVMAPCIIGCLIPSISVILVLIYSSFITLVRKQFDPSSLLFLNGNLNLSFVMPI